MWCSSGIYIGANFILRLHACFHSYTDDIQISLQLKRSCSAPLLTFLQSVDEVKVWMASNFLNVYENKTEVMVFEPSGNPITSHFNLHSLEPFIKSNGKNLLAIFDSNFTFEKQISSDAFSN